jgi:outer membrane protein assembly factor BamA
LLNCRAEMVRVRVSLCIRWLFLACLFAPCVLSAQGDSAANRRERPEILDVTITGAKDVDRGDLVDGIVTTASHCKNSFLAPFCWVSKSHLFYKREYLNRDELKRDVLRILIYCYKEGFRDAAVDTTLVPPYGARAKVTFTLTEGLPTRIDSLAITPDTLLSPRERREHVHLKVGQPLSLFALDSTLSEIRAVMWSRAYADAHVDTVITTHAGTPRSGPTATVLITITPGKKATIGTIAVAGNKKVSAETIRRSLTFKPDAPFLRDQVTDNQRTLYTSNMFRRATIGVTPDSARGDSVKDITISVDESPLHQAQARVGFTTTEFLQTSGQLTTYNFLGGGRQLTLTGGVANILAPQLNGNWPFQNVVRPSQDEGAPTSGFLSPEWNLGLDFLQPWFLSPDNSLGAGLFARRHIAPNVYIDEGYGANASFTRKLFEHVNVSLRYQFEESNVQASQVYYCINFGACDLPSFTALNGRHRLSPLSLIFDGTRVNNQSYPTEGYHTRAEFQYASDATASEFHYVRAYLDAAYYLSLGHWQNGPYGTGVLALRASAGWVRPLHPETPPDTAIADILHPRVRFYAGGANSVRGFGENQLGPRVLTIAPDSLRVRYIQESKSRVDTVTFCPPTTALSSCNPNATGTYKDGSGRVHTVSIRDQLFTPQPLGGNQELEGTVEYRFPIRGSLGAAIFVDAAVVGTGAGYYGEPVHAAGAATPGIGIRYYSSVGPIRVDVGFNPITTYNLLVVTQQGSGSTASLVELNGRRVYAPATEGGLSGLFNRITLNLSIGQAF